MVRWLWRATLLTLALTGLLGAALLALGAINDQTAKILGTSLTLSGSSLLAMANVAAWDRRRLRGLAALGMLGVLASTLMVLGMLWTDLALMRRETVQLFIVTLGLTHASFLSLSRPRTGLGWVRDGSVGATLLLTAFVCVLIQLDVDDALPLRLLAAHSVIVATGSVLTLLLHQRTRGKKDAESWSLRCTCPRCREDLRLGSGRNDCPKCGLEIAIRFQGA
ncbi:MAG: hypothetical protein AAGD10_14425 [Myxococcota bacterium]